MAIKRKKYYAYAVPGGENGVTDNWADCERTVKGVMDARFKSFDAEVDAKRWIEGGARYEPRPRAVPAPGIYFDAGTGRGTGVEVSVTDETGKNLLHKAIPKSKLNRFGKQLIKNGSATNNYGELLALRYALEIAKKMRAKQIFGDSKLVIEYWSQWRIKRKELPEETIKLADEVATLRKAFEKKGGVVQRISGGDNPADLGFH